MRHKESGCAILKHSFELQTASMASTSQTFIKLPLWNASTDKKILELQISQPSWAFMNLPMNHSYRGHISTETPPRRHVQQKVLSDASTRCVSHAHSHQRASCTSPDFFVKRGSSWNSLILEGLQPLLSFFPHLCDHICSHNFHMFSFMSPEHENIQASCCRCQAGVDHLSLLSAPCQLWLVCLMRWYFHVILKLEVSHVLRSVLI